jgi:hypothetical protein
MTMRASSFASGSPSRSARHTCDGCTPAADAGRPTASCSSGHPQAAAVSAVDSAVRTPAAVSSASRTPSAAAAVRSAAPDTAAAHSGQHRGQTGHRRQAADAAAVRAPAAESRPARRKQRPPLTYAGQPARSAQHGRTPASGRRGTPEVPSGHPAVPWTTWRSGGSPTAAGGRGRCGSRFRPGQRTAGSVRRDHHRRARVRPSGCTIRRPRPRSHFRLRAPLPHRPLSRGAAGTAWRHAEQRCCSTPSGLWVSMHAHIDPDQAVVEVGNGKTPTSRNNGPVDSGQNTQRRGSGGCCSAGRGRCAACPARGTSRSRSARPRQRWLARPAPAPATRRRDGGRPQQRPAHAGQLVSPGRGGGRSRRPPPGPPPPAWRGCWRRARRRSWG